MQLLQLGETWNRHYAMAVRSWENNWEDLATFFDYPAEIRRLIYTTNTIEGYNRQLRKVTKNKAFFPLRRRPGSCSTWPIATSPRSGPGPLMDWPKILNQLAIRFEERWPV